METAKPATTAKISSKPPKCSGCGELYTPQCDWRQGRCPNHPALMDSISVDKVKTKFYNLVKFFRGKK